MSIASLVICFTGLILICSFVILFRNDKILELRTSLIDFVFDKDDAGEYNTSVKDRLDWLITLEEQLSMVRKFWIYPDTFIVGKYAEEFFKWRELNGKKENPRG